MYIFYKDEVLLYNLKICNFFFQHYQRCIMIGIVWRIEFVLYLHIIESCIDMIISD